jgi:hypothetical protein
MIVVVSWSAVALYAAVAVPHALGADVLDTTVVAVSLGEFLLSLVVFAWAFAVAVARSARGDDIQVGSLFFLSGSAPRGVRAHLLGALGACVVVVAATAAADPFGVLVPMLPLMLAGLWGARHGSFPPRPARRDDARRRPGGPGGAR